MKILRVFLILAFCVELFGCSCDTGISPTQVVVLGNVYRHGGGGIQICLSHLGRPISDADVSVNGHRLIELPTEGTYLITRTSMPIESGVTYELTVKLGKNSITGTAVLCDSFSCLEPQLDSHHLQGEPLVATWTRSGTDYSYVLMIEEWHPEFVRRTHASPIVEDTVYTIPGEAFDGSGYYSIKIFSFENGVAYNCDILAFKNNNLTGGALGFFGSWRLAETMVWIDDSG
ncbi:MAG: hypothetical protein NTX17_05665 [Candidatus Eisenbacteria bacterium]|nr:hypothetical protein [Candidatus Eisenbacteria bacterium]